MLERVLLYIGEVLVVEGYYNHLTPGSTQAQLQGTRASRYTVGSIVVTETASSALMKAWRTVHHYVER